jgi:hypothetical protein
MWCQLIVIHLQYIVILFVLVRRHTLDVLVYVCMVQKFL